MKILNWFLIIVFIVGIIVLVLAPIGPMPGVFASGTASVVPESWGDTSATLEKDKSGR